MRTARTSNLHKPTLAVAALALFFSFGGGAYAAKKHYVLTSTKQVSPKTLKALKGNAGPAGTVGATGAAGPAGSKGADGAKGDTGPAGTARAYAIVNTQSCTGANGACGSVLKAKGVASVRRVQPGTYCVTLTSDIDSHAVPTMAGVDFRSTDSPEGNGTALIDAQNGHCDVAGLPNAFEVITERTPSSAVVVSGTVNTGAIKDNDVSFWVLVP